jgi:hypothetical protein
MKVQVDIHDDIIAKIMIAELKELMKDAKFADSKDDSAEITAACKTLLKYYLVPAK